LHSKKYFSGNGYHTNQYHLRYEENFPQDKAINEIRNYIAGGFTAWGRGFSKQSLFILARKFAESKIYKIQGKSTLWRSESLYVDLRTDIL
jgi:hypothetical protein